jgi:hypothetical protein
MKHDDKVLKLKDRIWKRKVAKNIEKATFLKDQNNCNLKSKKHFSLAGFFF